MCPLFFSDFNENNFLDRFSKNIRISDFTKNRPMRAEVFHADRHDEENCRFSQFCERAWKYQQFLCEHSDAFADKVKLLLYPTERKIPPFVRKASNSLLPVPPSHRKPEGLSVRFSQTRHCTLVWQGFKLEVEGPSCFCIILLRLYGFHFKVYNTCIVS